MNSFGSTTFVEIAGVAGTALCTYKSPEFFQYFRATTGTLNWFCIQEDSRRQGHGTTLLAGVYGAAKTHQVRRLTAQLQPAVGFDVNVYARFLGKAGFYCPWWARWMGWHNYVVMDIPNPQGEALLAAYPATAGLNKGTT